MTSNYTHRGLTTPAWYCLPPANTDVFFRRQYIYVIWKKISQIPKAEKGPLENHHCKHYSEGALRGGWIPVAPRSHFRVDNSGIPIFCATHTILSNYYIPSWALPIILAGQHFFRLKTNSNCIWLFITNFLKQGISFLHKKNKHRSLTD